MIEELKLYLRVDGNEEDAFLTSLHAAAKSYMKNAGVIEPIDTNDLTLYQLALKMMCAHWYENRIIVSSSGGTSNPVPYGVESIILQMRTHTVLEP